MMAIILVVIFRSVSFKSAEMIFLNYEVSGLSVSFLLCSFSIFALHIQFHVAALVAKRQ